jgi:hypothetical protein
MHRGKDFLKVELPDNAVGAHDVQEYLKRLLARLWIEGESFNGKRPFGDSSWQWVIYAAMVRENFVYGLLDDNGFVDEIDMVMADDLMMQAIEEL